MSTKLLYRFCIEDICCYLSKHHYIVLARVVLSMVRSCREQRNAKAHLCQDSETCREDYMCRDYDKCVHVRFCSLYDAAFGIKSREQWREVILKISRRTLDLLLFALTLGSRTNPIARSLLLYVARLAALLRRD